MDPSWDAPPNHARPKNARSLGSFSTNDFGAACGEAAVWVATGRVMGVGVPAPFALAWKHASERERATYASEMVGRLSATHLSDDNRASLRARLVVQMANRRDAVAYDKAAAAAREMLAEKEFVDQMVARCAGGPSSGDARPAAKALAQTLRRAIVSPGNAVAEMADLEKRLQHMDEVDAAVAALLNNA